jgi:hypothetical protein
VLALLKCVANKLPDLCHSLGATPLSLSLASVSRRRVAPSAQEKQQNQDAASEISETEEGCNSKKYLFRSHVHCFGVKNSPSRLYQIFK